VAGRSCLAGGDAGILGQAQGFRAVSCCTERSIRLSHGSEQRLPFARVSVLMGFNGVTRKERGFRLLKPCWGSEGCSQSDQQASEVASAGERL